MLLTEQAYKKIDRELAKFPADQRQSAVMAALAIAHKTIMRAMHTQTYTPPAVQDHPDLYD